MERFGKGLIIRRETPFKRGIYVVTVTYGERFRFLEQVIRGAFASGVDKIIAVDNGSAPLSRQALRKLEQDSDAKVAVVAMPENLGSASGYKAGMEFALNCSDCEYVWLLDDDNQPAEGALSEIFSHYEKLVHIVPPDRLVLASLREDWIHHRQIGQGMPVCKAFPRRSSFQWFHLLDLPKRLIRYFHPEKTGNTQGKVTSPVEIPFAPYGGLFFHKNVISRFGYPDERFFVYGDDTVYTYRLTLGGGRLFLIPGSVILDVERMWRLSTEAKHLFSALLISGSDLRVYYATRNQTYFDRHLWARNHVIYTLNKLAFFVMLTVFACRYGEWKRLALVARAVRQGEFGQLGRNRDLKD